MPNQDSTICGPVDSGSNPFDDGPSPPRTMEDVLRVAPVAWLTSAIESRLSPSLALRVTPPDLAQEVLMAFWQARDRFEWRGPQALRSYLLTLADRAISDAADHHFALKRGGAMAAAPFASSIAGDATTPSVAAERGERAEIMREALAAVPAEYRECVRLRLIEQATLKSIAVALALPESTVRRRFRIGSELFMHRLRDAFASRAVTQATRAVQSETHDDAPAIERRNVVPGPANSDFVR